MKPYPGDPIPLIFAKDFHSDEYLECHLLRLFIASHEYVVDKAEIIAELDLQGVLKDCKIRKLKRFYAF